jgi:CHAT domain-containing protein
VLSACESGRGGIRIDSISDYSGLPPALVSLGVRAVVATLWRIPDHLGALFADLFYERLAASTRVDLPWLVHDTSLGLRTLTASESAERLTALRAKVDDAITRVRLEAYARRLGRVGAEKPFGGPASWACFYHTGARYLHLPDPGQVS